MKALHNTVNYAMTLHTFNNHIQPIVAVLNQPINLTNPCLSIQGGLTVFALNRLQMHCQE